MWTQSYTAEILLYIVTRVCSKQSRQCNPTSSYWCATYTFYEERAKKQASKQTNTSKEKRQKKKKKKTAVTPAGGVAET